MDSDKAYNYNSEGDVLRRRAYDKVTDAPQQRWPPRSSSKEEEDNDNDNYFNRGPEFVSQSQIFSTLKDPDEQRSLCKCCKRFSFPRFCCCKKKDKKWEPPPEKPVFKSNEVAETKYPRIYRILEYKFWDALFVISCLASIFLFTFCEGFLIQSRLIWGLIHVANAVYIILLLLQWVQVILMAKYGESHVSMDIIFSLLSVLPVDLIVLLVYSLNDDGTPDAPSAESHLAFTLSRLHYIFRIKNILNYLFNHMSWVKKQNYAHPYLKLYFQKSFLEIAFSMDTNWENQLILGDFYSFLLRVILYTTLLIHTFACIWHRVACKSFRSKHFIMDPFRAREEICEPNSWIMKLSEKANENVNSTKFTAFLHGTQAQSNYMILWDHYAASMYWSVCTSFHVGFGDVEINLASTYEVVFTALVQIISWIFVLAVVIGTLTSLLIESDTERESFLTRRFAISHYLRFSRVRRSVVHEVKKFYDYLWSKRKGVSELMLIDIMPNAMKSEIFFDIHKFVLEQMPLFQDFESSFMMTLSIRMTHSFHLTGETLFRRHELGDHMYYVLKGHLDIMSADESHPIACIRSGSAIGDIFLVHPYIHCCTIRCGSECDILALTRESVTEVLKDYPQYVDILQTRIQERFESCVLLLSLAAKYNEAPQLFSQLPYEIPPADIVDNPFSFEEEEGVKAGNTKGNAGSDADGLSLTSSVMDKMSTLYLTAAQKKEKKMNKRRRNALEEAYAAFAADVNRTCLLAKDLGIGRAPLLVSSPNEVVSSNTSDSKINVRSDRDNIFSKLVPMLKNEERSSVFLTWKFLVALCICLAMYYYPYMIAFRSTDVSSNLEYDTAMHLVDVIFIVDFSFDMFRMVVTPQKTLERLPDILCYHAKTPLFYLRIFSFFPIEYMLALIFRMECGKSAYYYLFKCNRFFQLIVLMDFFQDLEGATKIPMMSLFLTKYLVAMFFVIHTFAVLYEYILRDWLPGVIEVIPKHLGDSSVRTYEFVLYWSTQVVTTAGFGDIAYYYKEEIVIFCIAFMTGTVVVTYLGSKLAAILANAQRRRISFTQTYYGVTTFLKHRKFPDDLSRRIRAYYKMQWAAHEGVLIPKERSAIWDAPEAIIDEVSLSQSMRFISRVPIIRYTSEIVIKKMCRALKQYFVPPDECVQFEGDKRRELYIIVKGFCKVSRGSECIGYLTEGNYFGLNGLVAGINQEYRITTETHCLFFCLQFDDFVEISKDFKLLRKDYMVLRRESALEELKRVVEHNAVIRLPQTQDLNQNLARIKSSSIVSENENYSSNVFGTYSSVTFMDPDNETSFRKRKNKLLRFFLLRRTFLPSGVFMTCWISFRVFIGAVASFCVLLHLAFAFEPTNSFILTLTFDIIAWIDIYLMLHVSYYNESNQLITDPIRTARHYFHGAFILDILFSFPFDLIAIIVNPGIHVLGHKHSYLGKYRTISILRLNRAFQPYKLIQVGIKLNRTIFRSLSLITLIEVMPWMLLSIHIMACIAVLRVCDVSSNGDKFNCSTDAWLTHGSYYQGIDYQEPDLNNPVKMYLISFYWTIVVALRVGFGDLDLLTPQNRRISVFIVFAGSIITSYLSSKLTACMVGEDSRRIEIRTKIDIMYSFLDRFKASSSVKRRVKEIYFNEWDKTKGISVDTLFVALHPSLKADVMCHLYEDSIRQSPLLKTLDEPGIRMLASILREVFIVEGEYIFKYGNITDDLFLISSGIVAAYNAQGDVMSYMGTGSLIGEISALYGVTRLYSAVAATDVDMLVFSAEDFLEFMELYPELKEALEQLCENMTQARQIGERMGSGSSELLVPGSATPFQKSKKQGKVEDGMDEDEEEVEEVILDASSETKSSRMNSKEGQNVVKVSRNLLCVLDPLRVPLKSGQFLDNEKDIMLSGSESLANKKWWSVFVTFGRVPKTEMGTLLHIYQDKKRCNLLNFTIHPSSPMVRGSGWSVFNLLVTAISCALTAYEISFASSDQSETLPVVILRYTAEIFFVVRIIGNFHLGYLDDSGVLITDVRKIVRRYLTSIDGFILDIATTIPFYGIAYLVGEPDRNTYAANIRGIQLLRVVLFVRYLSESGSDLEMKASEVKILKITILLCFIFHFCACAWYLVACYGMTCKDNSWMEILLHKLLDSKNIDKSDEITIGSRYWISLAYVTTTITATGLSDVTPRLTIELIATICFIFGTVFILGLLLGEMTQCLASQISSKIHYEHELSVIESHLGGLGLNKSKRESVSEYYKLVWRRFRGIPYYNLLKELPYPLRADITFEIYGPNIRMSRVLGKVGDQIIRQITARIRHEFYLPGGYIVRGGNVCDAMYFIKRGEVVIIDENMGIELVVDTLRENDCFGEVKILLPREPFRFSYVARVETEVGMLRRQDLDEVFRNFPATKCETVERAKKIKSHRSEGMKDRREMESKLNENTNNPNARDNPLDTQKQNSGSGSSQVQQEQSASNKHPNNTTYENQTNLGKTNNEKAVGSKRSRVTTTTQMVPKEMRKASIAKIETITHASTPPHLRFEQRQQQRQPQYDSSSDRDSRQNQSNNMPRKIHSYYYKPDVMARMMQPKPQLQPKLPEPPLPYLYPFPESTKQNMSGEMKEEPRTNVPNTDTSNDTGIDSSVKPNINPLPSSLPQQSPPIIPNAVQTPVPVDIAQQLPTFSTSPTNPPPVVETVTTGKQIQLQPSQPKAQVATKAKSESKPTKPQPSPKSKPKPTDTTSPKENKKK